MGTGETLDTHPPEEMLEEYALGRAREPDLARIEEHLLVCDQCQDALAEADDFIAVMKRSTKALQKEKPIAMPRRPRQLWLGHLVPRGNPVWIGALGAAMLAIMVWLPRPPAAAYEAEATLQVMRGAEAGAAAVPAGKRFLLKADLTEIPLAPAYRLEIVSSDGAIVWRGTAPRRDSGLAVVVADRLRAGRYWVRLSDDSGTLLREYGLESR